MDSRRLRRALNAVPRSESLFKLARLYVNFHEGQDDPDFRTNGEERTLRALLPGCSVAFDVGAHVGDWTALALEIEPALQVHCFEPSRDSFQRLQGRLGAAARLNNEGLSDAAGEAALHVHPHEPDRNSLYGEGSSEPIRLRTLADYCEAESVERIDYLKVDTEGHELAVLRGADRMLSEGRIRHVQVEYGPGYLDAGATLRDLMGYLGGFGYRASKILPRGPRPVPAYSPELENFTLSNWLFSRDQSHSGSGQAGQARSKRSSVRR